MELKEHDIVILTKDYGGIAEGSYGTIVHLYGPDADVIEVEFAGGKVVAMPGDCVVPDTELVDTEI